MLRFLTFIFIFSFALNSYSHTILTKQIPKHVIIIGIDGLGGVFLKEYYDSKYAVNPSNFKVLESQSLYTYYMRNEDPTGSGPNWASMVTGVSPNVHKIKSNADLITADQILDKIEKNIEKAYIKKILKEKGPYKKFKQKVRKSNKIFKVYKKLNYNLEKQQKKQDSLGIKEAPETFNLENIFKELRKTYSEFSDLFKKKYTPTFFDYVKENDPDRQIRVYHEWPLFKQLIKRT